MGHGAYHTDSAAYAMRVPGTSKGRCRRHRTHRHTPAYAMQVPDNAKGLCREIGDPTWASRPHAPRSSPAFNCPA
eukprot:2762782-Rhodomonas_salina.1